MSNDLIWPTVFSMSGSASSGLSFDHPEPLRPAISGTRTFSAQRKVRLGDVDRLGRLRLDALTRYTQDVSDDDITDSGLRDSGWIVRATTVDEITPAIISEHLSFTTFCSGTGSRWAERRLSIRGDQGAHLEVMTIWVAVDPVSGRPRRLTDQFHEVFGSSAGGRDASSKLGNPKPEAVSADGGVVEVHPWFIRDVDFDIFNHVNNAAFWVVLEQWLPKPDAPRRFRMEYASGISELGSVPVAIADHGSARMWWWAGDRSAVDSQPSEWSSVAASAIAMPLPEGLYS